MGTCQSLPYAALGLPPDGARRLPPSAGVAYDPGSGTLFAPAGSVLGAAGSLHHHVGSPVAANQQLQLSICALEISARSGDGPRRRRIS